MQGAMMNMMAGAQGPMMGSMARSMMAPERIEGRIAFLRTELRITAAQQRAWDAFADVLRTDVRTMTEMRGAMMRPADALPERIAAYERLLAARLDGLRRLKVALEPLYAALDDVQKQTADELIMAGPMGRM